ncbi:hypothetical protein ABB29_06500 [Pseudoxanthomonas dokdonensis]|uniref:Uncharacterized protein n=1 Tax=Pseudoxanthomonas dokdonensis TaxID=344882 RepID=A0A0R0CV77_9GAMM|nr:hypothetical protein ABB29_06500 [Pseudoxanthomonas dokdonensis]
MALALQALLLALLWRMPTLNAERRGIAGEPTRIRLSWLARPAPPPPMPQQPAEPAAPAMAGPAPPRNPDRPRPSRVPSPPPAATATEPPASASDYSARARDWAQRQKPSLFAPEPLANRKPRLPGGEAPERFRMKPPPSAKAVLDGIGELFGGRGYSQGPCPEIRRQAEAWKTDTSEQGRARLAHELERERRHCRP